MAAREHPTPSPSVVPPPSAAEDPAAALVAAGLEGPVLVVADDDSIGRLAPAWAASFAAVGWVHRVVAGRDADPAEVESLAAEARSLKAATVIGTGGASVRAAARAAAAAVGRPVVEAATGGS
jgi:glycerol dehydrogenase-like iron-containing ADH family enzyme